MLDSSDCQSIRSKTTFRDQVQQLIGLLNKRQSSKGEQGFDVLVDALKRQRVQAHIARTLQKALARAKDSNGMLNVSQGTGLYVTRSVKEGLKHLGYDYCLDVDSHLIPPGPNVRGGLYEAIL